MFKTFLFILLLLAGCQSFLASSSSISEGRVNLYLSTSSKSPPDITFSLEKIELEGEDRKWITLFKGKKEINSITLVDHQIFIAETDLSAGRYRRLRVTVTDASIVRAGKKRSLALASTSEDNTLFIQFQMYRNECNSLFLNWDPDKSIKDKYLFIPVITLKPQKMEIRRLVLYVTNTGSNSITVINRQNDHVVGTICVDKAPMGIVANPLGDIVYVANSDSNTISIIDTSHHRVIDTIPINLGISPRELAISPDGSRLYVSNYHSNNVSVIDTVSINLLGQFHVGNNPLGIATNTRGNRLYVVNSASNNLSVIDPSIFKVIKTVTLGSNPTDLLVDENRILIANAGSNRIYQINIHSLIVEKEMSAGLGSHRLISGLMDNIYSSNRNSNDISIIPSSTNIEIQRIAVHDIPQGMALDRERRKLYVANEGSNNVSVIDLIKEKMIVSIPVGNKPYGLALVK
ncbi:MAG: YncE family protein [Spirochaetota bacterium]|nr:YncE family protein [Spirochaetota bacterium]